MSDSEDERPSFGAPRRKFDESEPEGQQNEQPAKRIRFNQARGGRNAASSRGGGAPAYSKAGSFASRMMAQMGYKEGEGLGKEGRGRLAPIETQLRPQGAGLGVVKEKTKQAKEEEKRAAAFRGEVVEESSGEERKRRKKERERRIVGSGTSTPKARPKIKYRTATEIEQQSEGLKVPDVLKTLIDVTGKETQLLSSAAGPMVASETEEIKIAKRARRDLEAFSDEWSALQDRKRYFDLEFEHTVGELDGQDVEMSDLRKAIEDIQQLELLDPTSDQWEATVKQLERMEVTFKDRKNSEKTALNLQEIAVATIHPMFRQAMLEWQPLEASTSLVPYLERLQHILGIQAQANDTALVAHDVHLISRPNQKSTSYYESMIYTLWLPPVRNAITNDWDVEDPTPLSRLIDAWRPLIPQFILSNIIDQLLLPRLFSALSKWKPRRSASSHRRAHTQSPHVWLFPWLSYLPAHHLDPGSSSGLLAEARRKLRSLLDTHDPPAGIPTWLSPWQPLLKSTYTTLLTNRLLPRLGKYLSENLTIDPSDQDLTPFETVLAYMPLFSPTAFAHLLVQHFFPKFHSTLYQWLTSEPSFEEIRQWFLWWKDTIPAELRDLPPIEAEWTLALEMINLALELGERAATELPPPVLTPISLPPTAPASGPATPAAAKTPPARSLPQIQIQVPLEQSFKTIVEEWAEAEENGLLLIPLHQAHDRMGLPLFRLTASATGKGGTVVYLKGDVLWARSEKDRKVFEPMELGPALVRRAGG